MTKRTEFPVANVQKIDVGQHLFGADSGRKPANFITLNGLRRHGWKQIPAGWLLESSRPLTSGQIADARDAAAETGLTIETRRKKNPPTGVMAIATAAGATSRIRRTLTATTAGALALLGALLGVAGAYISLTALYHNDLGYLSDVPVTYLVLAVTGVPLVATAAGWLLAGREPHAIARPVIE
jgi:putative ABC transport system permease protein